MRTGSCEPVDVNVTLNVRLRRQNRGVRGRILTDDVQLELGPVPDLIEPQTLILHPIRL
ncbi:hypothetical protein D3C83_335150 [compost metagenome]